MVDYVDYPPLPGDGVPVELALRGVSSDVSEDTIRYSEVPGDPRYVEIEFSVPDHIDWWKGLEVKAPDGQVVAVLETHEGNRRPPSLRLDASRMTGHTIWLLKAMMFGVHTARYRLDRPTLDQKAGRIMKFEWVSD